MPPKKTPTGLASQKSLLPTPATAAVPLGSNARVPLPAPVLPPSDSILPLWNPSSRPRDLFPEWPSAAALAAENWGSPDVLFEDTLPLSELFVPRQTPQTTISWKRPSQFLPPLVEPAPSHLHATLSATTAPSEPKTPAAKRTGASAGAAAATPATKKPTAAELEAAKRVPPPVKYAHVFFTDPSLSHTVDSSSNSASAVDTKRSNMNTTAAPTTAVAHRSSSIATTTLHSSASAAHLQRPFTPIPRDFRRLWSADECAERLQWDAEEARIAAATQHRERLDMGFEDAIAFVVNDRSRCFTHDDDVDADDLVDDGQDDDDDTDETQAASSNASTPYGILPPAHSAIPPNAITKPLHPHGDVVHASMASLFRIVESLFATWSSSSGGGSNSSSAAAFAPLPPPFLWQAIYPQDATTSQPLYNPSGKYAVKLFVAGKWRRVDIDDRLPVDDATNDIVFVTSALSSEIWPALLTKALYKVLHWLFHDDDVTMKDDDVRRPSVRVVHTVIAALTGWKTTRWTTLRSPDTTPTNETKLQQLLEFIPAIHATDDSVDDTNDATDESALKGADTNARSHRIESLSPVALTPRAVVCSTCAHDTASLYAGEAALVSDIVGDIESTTLKVASLRGTASIPEDVVETDSVEIVLLHPPSLHSDVLVQQWMPPVAASDAIASPAVAAATANAATTAAGERLSSPFANPVTQFAQITLLPIAQAPSQAAGAASSESLRAQTVDVVLTLTRIAPIDAAAHAIDLRLRNARAMAQFVPEMDALGSVVLIEERKQRDAAFETPPLRIVTLTTTASTRVVLPATQASVVFRVQPQSSLCYGYSLQIESTRCRVGFHTASTFWRNGCNFQVVNCDGAYPMLLPRTWSVLFKHTIELAPATTLSPSPSAISISAASVTSAGGSSDAAPLELYVDLHIADAMLVPFVRVSVIDDETNETTTLRSLCSVVPFASVASEASSAATAQQRTLTLVVDCASLPTGCYVPDGKWHLTLGSNWLFRASSTHAMKRTVFEAPYDANKPLLLFRDIVVVTPSKSLWTSLELEVLSSTGNSNDDDDDAIADALAVKLQVIDAATEQVLSETSAQRVVRLLQLPPRRPLSTTSESDPSALDAGRYILQGTLDSSRCVVPASLCSVRPFRNSCTIDRGTGAAAAAAAAAGGTDLKASAVAEETVDDAVVAATGFPLSARPPTSVKWRLSCWSTDDVKLEVDRTKEDRYDAIRAAWVDDAKHRTGVTHGAVSRLLFLGKRDAADATIRCDNVSDELAARIKARFDWLAAAAASDRVANDDGPFLELRAPMDGDVEECMKTTEAFDLDECVLRERLDAAQTIDALQREDRAAAKARRVHEVHDLVQSIRTKRSAALKTRAKLWQARDALLHPQPSS